jgi:hypothetical protein
MKRILLILIIMSLFGNVGTAQDINWKNINNEYRHILNINAGIDYGFAYGIGYSYKTKIKFPLLLNVEYTSASGKNLFDDFKTKTGLKINWYKTGSFYFSSKIQGVFRRQETALVRLLNFGSDLSGSAGYYRPRWFGAFEFGFDKAIITHFKNSAFAKQNFPGIKDGWYEPTTGGNFYYGIQAGFSEKTIDVYLNLGKIINQDFKSKPTIPVYAQLGFNLKMKGRSYRVW